MTLFEVEELAAYWAEHPPVHLLLARYLGIGAGRQRRPLAPQGAASDPAALLGALGPGFEAGDVHAGLAPAALDFVELKRRRAAQR